MDWIFGIGALFSTGITASGYDFLKTPISLGALTDIAMIIIWESNLSAVEERREAKEGPWER